MDVTIEQTLANSSIKKISCQNHQARLIRGKSCWINCPKGLEIKIFLSLYLCIFRQINGGTADLNIRTGHLNEQFGFERKDIEHIVIHQYANDFASEGNPRDYKFEDCVKLLEDLL